MAWQRMGPKLCREIRKATKMAKRRKKYDILMIILTILAIVFLISLITVGFMFVKEYIFPSTPAIEHFLDALADSTCNSKGAI